MKLQQIYEGLQIKKEETGKTVIDYHFEGKDDPWFSAVTKTIIPPTTKNINLFKDDFSDAEIHELKQHISQNPKGYQKVMPLYVAMPIFNVGERTDDFLDALKRRNEDKISFTKEGLKRLLQKGAKAVVRQLTDRFRDLSKFDTILAVPVPSGKQLVYDFLNTVVEELRKQGGDVKIALNLLSKAKTPKYGTILRGRRLESSPRSDNFHNRYKTFRKEAYDQMLSAYRNNRMTDEQLIDVYDERTQTIENRLTDLQKRPMNEKTKSEIEALNQEKQYLEQFLEKITDPSITQRDTLSQEEIKTIRGFLRRLSYDRFTVKPDTSIDQFGKRVLIVLIDDNVDTSKSLIDAYRILFKNGIAHVPQSYVVAMALHDLKS